MRIAKSWMALVVLGGWAACATQASMFAAEPAPLVTGFSVTQKTKVPGKVLKAGDYSIRVVDHLSDRVILQIEDPKGKPQTTFIAVENSTLRKTGSSGPVLWSAKKGDEAMRGFTFPGGSAVEFVYPKDEAVSIAKDTSGNVAAIDPASEGHTSAKHLSNQDLQLLTLWSLSPTRVGPADHSQAAIQAERYQVPAVQVAAAQKPAPAIWAKYPDGPPSTSSARATPVSVRSSAPVHRPALMASLPHTAGDQPLIALGGLAAAMAAGLVRYRRKNALGCS